MASLYDHSWMSFILGYYCNDDGGVCASIIKSARDSYLKDTINFQSLYIQTLSLGKDLQTNAYILRNLFTNIFFDTFIWLI